MKQFKYLLLLSVFSSQLLLTGCNKDDDPQTPTKPDLVFYGLTAGNQLAKFNANASQTAMSNVAITGLQTGESLLAIDFRPATGQLYGLGSTSRLYIINPETGTSTAVGAGPFSPALNGNLAGFDFNPTVDRIRVTTNLGQNLRLHPETGAVATADVALNPGTPSIIGSAYTNSVAGAATTELFNIDIAANKLFKQDPPNNGTLVEIGALGVTATGNGGFDIAPDNSVALACLTVGGTNGLYQINTATGAATSLGNIGTPIIGLAIPTNPVAYAIDNSNNLLIFNFTKSGTPVSKTITGLQASENIMGIDMRPVTGQLYALGSSSRLYTINMSSGAAVMVGTLPLVPALAGTSFGFDFNPTVDRIRVVSNTGQNLRLHPETGLVAFNDGALNPGTPDISAAAYTNNFPGATTTALFDIDATTDKLYKQDPPNNGTLTEVGALGVNVDTNSGFDIGGRSNLAYALLTVGSATKIYTINLTTGAATALTDFPMTAKAFAIGVGF